ncbi:MAG TPA: FHA domain-containing protein [Labilithrix sp.]|nr:FHA domain-containing protein [Labilithrix sp.]
MEEIRFEVRHPDGRSERLVVSAPKATIGTGAHCDVRLAVDQAASEHVVVALVPDGLQLKSLASTPPALLDGAPLAVSVVPQWALLKVGGTQVHVARAARTTAAQSKLNSTTIVRLCCAVSLPLAFMALPASSRGQASAEAPEMPALFDSELVACPRSDPAEARVVADDERAIADAARERSPFSSREAITAVRAYDIAAACYRVAHEARDATEAAAASKELRDATLLDVRARSLRLERSLTVGDLELAGSDVAVLKAFTDGRQGPYVAWLSSVEQRIKNQGATVR